MDEQYHGWENFETWLAFSWLVNSENIITMLTSPIDGNRNRTDAMRHRVTAVISDWRVVCPSSGLMADLLDYGIGNINLDALATALLDKMEK